MAAPPGWRLLPVGADGACLLDKVQILGAARKAPSAADADAWQVLPGWSGWGVLCGTPAGPWLGDEAGARWAVAGPRWLHDSRPAGSKPGLAVVPLQALVDLRPTLDVDVSSDDDPPWVPVSWPKPPPEVPLDLVPPALADVVQRWVDLIGVQPTVALAAALGSLSTALAGRIEIALGGGWYERNPALYVICAMASGLRKTPLMDLAIEPWWPVQKAAVERWREAVQDYAIKRADAEASLGKRHARNAEDEGPSMDREEALHVLAQGEPQPPAILVSDFTPEALGLGLIHTPAIFLHSDEADEFFKAATRGQQIQLGPLLKAYSAAPLGGTLRITRKVQIAAGTRPRAGMLGLCQPSVLYGAAQHREFLEQGLLGRGLWAVAMEDGGPDLPRLEARLPGAFDQAKDLWGALVGRAFALPQVERAADGSEATDPALWRVCPRGEYALLEYADDCKARAAPGADLHDLQTWLRKAHGHAVRLAASLAIAGTGLDAGGGIPLATVEAAIVLARAFEAHARAAWQLAGWPPDTDDARHLWLRAGALRGAGRPSTVRAIEEALDPGPDWSPARVDKALAILEERGFARLVRPKRGRPSAVTWNPLAS